MYRSVTVVQGLYFLMTGLWPLLSIRTFMQVTGPKTDVWLVKTVGALVTAIAASLLVAGMRGDVQSPTIVLALGSAAGLAVIDVIYVLKRVIAPIYLADAGAEVVLIIWWMISVAGV